MSAFPKACIHSFLIDFVVKYNHENKLKQKRREITR